VRLAERCPAAAVENQTTIANALGQPSAADALLAEPAAR
jgi:hypothetical protein